MTPLTAEEIARIRGTIANPIAHVERVTEIAEALPRLLDEVEQMRETLRLAHPYVAESDPHMTVDGHSRDEILGMIAALLGGGP